MPLPCIEKTTGPNPRHAVIWLHGLGADGNDFLPIVPELVDPNWPPLRFVFPHAPVRPITINGGMAMRAWYDISGMEIAQRQDEAGIRASIGLLEELIQRETARGTAAANIFLAGFSQGGAIVLSGGIRHTHKLGGIIALSTYLPMAEKTDAEASAGNRATPIFMAHGMLDPTISHALGEMSRDYLVQRGYTVDWHAYPMAHQVCMEEIADLRAWMSPRLAN
ncbi:MAG: carboxylesterase [Xanthomonadales bacterium PRO7]|jgi:phospholipase/carboxylesterase|nr:carboxylesterase [Xanthomonadales bacterium PRO7]HMM56059.1 carboxylesterase [Rudaea sp.]